MDHRRRAQRRLTGRASTVVAYAVCLGIAAALAGYQLAQPHDLNGVHGIANAGYDDGVYLAATSNFVHGVMPYRDFAFLQPPGVVVVLAPLGLLGRLVGTATELQIARLLVLAISLVNVGLVMSLARVRGRSAAVLAGVIVACYPLASAATNSLYLEPILALLVLAAARVAFTRDGGIATARRVVVAGALLGLATNVKVWGAAACVALLVVAVRSSRLRAATLGIAAGIVVPLAPFVALAPHAIYHDALIAQLHRHDVLDTWSSVRRLDLLLGLNSQSDPTWHTGAAVAVTIAICVVVGGAFVVRRLRMEPLTWFLLVSSIVFVAGLLAAHEFYDHYGYAVVVVAAPLVAISSMTLARTIPRPFSPRMRALAVTAAVAAAVIALGVPASVGNTSRLLADNFAVPDTVAAIVPEGACAVSDYPTLLVLTDRWDTASTCTRVVDPFGLYVSASERPPPGERPFPAALTDPWRRAFGNADYAVLVYANTDYVPWDDSLRATYDARFVTLVGAGVPVIAKARGA